MVCVCRGGGGGRAGAGIGEGKRIFSDNKSEFEKYFVLGLEWGAGVGSWLRGWLRNFGHIDKESKSVFWEEVGK